MASKSSTTGPYKDKEKVYSKMASYPWWPGFITPDEYIPKQVKKSKKKNTPYCVIFIPDGDFYWATEKGLRKFTDGPIISGGSTTKKSNKSKSTPTTNIEKFKDLKFLKKRLRPKTGTADISEANIAAENLDFDDFITIFQELSDDEDNEEEEEEEEEDEEEDEEEQEEVKQEEKEEETSKPVKSKPVPKPALKPKPKLKDSTPAKESSIELSPPTRKRSPLTSEKITKKPKLEDDIDSKSIVKEESQPPSKEEDKYQQLYFCRIKLQRSLIQRTSTTTETKKESSPTADELSMARLILHRLKTFPVTQELLRDTKIHKVLRAILKDQSLELEQSFKLHQHCKELLDSWAPLLQNINHSKLEDVGVKDESDEKSIKTA
ncbi:hypothetical protein KGF54_000443 [Candida jiufengensis]|uniref:uncharacterized protein n=1 Tax=Candida jiufengensis TaxID=497108 RepID=UPI0022243CB2|nr:uncharacterized protein KGF54_000443 [Candida jiufengensis]KAI5956825.1 hypothetical protein KGF54_000443 [Candida jiufengensis]